MILARNQGLSLIADSTSDAVWTRHFLDSAQLAKLIRHPQESVVDLGTGAGFPGVVLAIMGLPKVHLIENNMQKVAFLRAVVAELRLDVAIHAMKIQAVKPFVAGAVTSRALKPLNQLLGLAARFIGADTDCVFLKGRRAEEELADAARCWRMSVERFSSVTSTDSTIFRLTHITKAGA